MDILTAENYRQIDEQLERSLSRRPLEGDFRGFLFVLPPLSGHDALIKSQSGPERACVRAKTG